MADTINENLIAQIRKQFENVLEVYRRITEQEVLKKTNYRLNYKPIITENKKNLSIIFYF